MQKTNKTDDNTEIILKSLKKSVNKALDKKRRLGQYAVVEINGKIIKLFDQTEKTEKTQ